MKIFVRASVFPSPSEHEKPFHFLTSIDANKRALSHVIQTADAPAFVLGFEELETHLKAVLHQSVGAHLRAAFAPLITLVDPE